MDNYAIMMEAARNRFLTYAPGVFWDKTGVTVLEKRLFTPFLGETAEISLKTGHISFGGRSADFGESLCLYDWLCDGAQNAHPAGEFAPVASLPGVLVRGNGLTMDTGFLADRIEAFPEDFCRVCQAMDGKKRDIGDISYEIPLFADLTMVLKFYFGDEEFPPGLTLLWDKNILKYIRYETVYYLAGCVEKRLERGMAPA